MKLLLTLFCLLLSLNTYAIDCSTLWARGFPDEQTGTSILECEQYLPHRTARVPNNIKIYLDRKLQDVEGYDRVLKNVAIGAGQTHRALKDAFDTSNINIVLYHKSHAIDPLVYAFTSPLHNHPTLEACPIVVYLPILTFPDEYIQQLIAHEMFHCMSFKKFPQQMTAGMLDRRNAWHYEGLAQFFSNLIFPRANWEYSEFFPSLYDGERQLTRQASAYRAAHFWQSYFWFIGGNITVLLDFIASLPTAVGANPIRLFNKLPTADKAFHKFAEEMFTQTLKDSDMSTGHPIMMITPLEYNLTEDNVQEFELRYRTISLFSHRIKLKPGYKYNFKINLPDNESIASIRLVEDSTQFERLPRSYEIKCDTEYTAEIIVTTTGEDENLRKAKLVVEQTKNETCETCDVSEPLIDQCLVGNWEIDRDSYRRMKEQTLPPLGQKLTSISGGYYLVIAESVLAIGYIDFLLTYDGVFNGIPMTMTHLYQGEGRAFIQAENGKGCLKKIGSLMSVVQTIKTPYGDTSTVLPHDFEAPGINFKYQCSPRELKFIYSQNPNDGSSITYEIIYNKII